MESLRQVIEALVDQLHDHAAKVLTGMLLVAAGWFFGQRRARHAWRKREFYDRLNLSLNFLEGQRLKIRTLSEKACSEVFLNQAATEKVSEYARKTTAEDPLLPIPKEEYWHYLNPVLNELSEQFADGLLRQGLGLNVTSALFIVCLTCESAGPLRMRKIRAMVIQKNVLQTLADEAPAFDHPHHETRWQTLHFMKREYAAKPWRFIEVELAV